MVKQLKISLSDKDSEKWGINEIAYRLVMSRWGVTEDVIPYVDRESTKEERDYMFGELLKEVRNLNEHMKAQIKAQAAPLEASKEEIAMAIRFLLGVIATIVLLGLFLVWLF